MQYKNKQFIQCRIYLFFNHSKKSHDPNSSSLRKVTLTLQTRSEETTRAEAGAWGTSTGEWLVVVALCRIYCMFLLKCSSMKQLMMLFLAGIQGFKGLQSFSFQLLNRTILAPESQYSFATNKKTESGIISLLWRLLLKSQNLESFLYTYPKGGLQEYDFL